VYEQLVTVGIIVILLDSGLVIIGSILNTSKSNSNTKTEWGFFGLIGPFPIGFGSSKQSFLFTVAMAAIFITMFIILNYLYR